MAYFSRKCITGNLDIKGRVTNLIIDQIESFPRKLIKPDGILAIDTQDSKACLTLILVISTSIGHSHEISVIKEAPYEALSKIAITTKDKDLSVLTHMGRCLEVLTPPYSPVN